ncbi:FtsW/RodA/SpoVE family cell cycle protein [Paenibacillus sp. UMB4589-SE434]|uniref:FtsW/RodA/SpoVE family cell cycle protein n=1 Tax=Paenibacillus sp. UMB4589-SE434 TaxID=3046314 RepID=UPI00255185DA|nr:FtsW/RodA/SpoVE family cell cycle protein [Paenibacillus sp. UMB4589-SE434]MDK8181495.1 FtsW/RodA/SpoVE family cell cycle protein [Paenibacillus sp. UMB4589-SE434]
MCIDADCQCACDERFAAYVQDVLNHVKAKDMHKQISDELLDHLWSAQEEAVGSGFSALEAAESSMKQMGPAKQLSDTFNLIHRHRWPWEIWGLVAVWIMIYLIAFISHELSVNSLTSSYEGEYSFIASRIFYLGMGLLIFTAAILIHYRRWLHGGVWLYVLVLGLFLLGKISSMGGNMIGSRSYLSGLGGAIDIGAVSPFVFLLAFLLTVHHIGTLNVLRHRMLLFIMGFTPIFIYVYEYRMYQLLFYLLGMAGLLLLLKRYKLMLYGMISLCIGGGVVLSTNYELLNYITRRLEGWPAPIFDPSLDYGYRAIREALTSAGWWGEGIGSLLPVPHTISDNLSVFVVHTFGWSAGLLMLVVMGMLIYGLHRAALAVPHRLGRLIMQLVPMLLSIKILIYLCGIIGIIPLNGAGLPMLGAGGHSENIGWLFMFGVFSSVYIRKDIIPLLQDDSAPIK